MTDQIVGSNLVLRGNQMKQVVLENLLQDPTTLLITGRVWWNGRPKVYNGTEIKAIAYTDDLMNPAAHTHPISEVTGLQAALNGKQSTIVGAASTVTEADLGQSMAMVTDANGKIAASSKVTSTELEYLDGVLSPIQAQIADKIPVGQKGIANGVATLDSGGKVPSTQLPSYVDDIIEVATYAALPTTGQTGVIYVITSGPDINKQYRWTGTAYTMISSPIGLSNVAGSAVNTSASAGTSSDAARADHVHNLADSVVTEAKIASNAVTENKIANSAVTTTKIATGAVRTSQINDNAVTNAKLAATSAYSVKGNNTSSSSWCVDLTMTQLYDILFSQVANMPKISRVVNPALTQSGGLCTWTISAGATRTVGGYKTASVQVYELGTDGATTASQILVATSIGKTSGDITIYINSATNITAGTYVAVITD